MANRPGEWYQGIFEPQHPEKIIGNKKPIFRSSYEKRVMSWADMNPNVIRWGSECIVLPYQYELDGNPHKYYLDFYFEIKSKTGVIKKYIVEVKPKSQLQRPQPPKNKNNKATKRYIYEMSMFIKNNNKWKFASAWAKSKGMEFKILTEDQIFG